MQTDAFRRLKFELCEYLRLYGAGLKKRANAHLKGAVCKFKSEFSEAERDYALGKLCREILDETESELKNLKNRGNGELPFRLGELVGEYLKRRCIAGAMPHLRWAYQICARSLRGLDKNDLLRRAYRHERCDTCTVELYFCMLLDALDWGAHHFPEVCLIERAYYEQLIREARDVREKHEISARLNLEFEYFIKLYECYFEFKSCGGEVDFYALCKEAGLNLRPQSLFIMSSERSLNLTINLKRAPNL
ncbi:hypothetical protein [Campylobacter rectus]|uniref:hypothetical protein n=1 Tax=Campylobacter rectus TaxID=203 RepID=UPI0028E3BC38|nr:hypothetical protein [Campylobacter rectus]